MHVSYPSMRTQEVRDPHNTPLVDVTEWYAALDQENIPLITSYLKAGIAEQFRQENRIGGRYRRDNESLRHAIRTGNPEIVRLLFQSGFKANNIFFHNDLDIYDGFPFFVEQRPQAIHWLCLYETNLGVLEVFLQHGANPNAYDGSQFPLTMAAFGTDVEGAIRMLVKYGADVNAKDKYGQTILQYILSPDSRYGGVRIEEAARQKAVETLIELGAKRE